jgi:hypothetical protein
MFPEERTKPYQINRQAYPTVTIYWMAEDVQRGRPVILHELNCMFCKRTVATELRGNLVAIINAPVSLAGFGLGMTIRCKQCKQNYRIIATDSFLG